MKAAYNELLSEKQRSDEAASEVNNLKKELNRAHKVCQSALILLLSYYKQSICTNTGS